MDGEQPEAITETITSGISTVKAYRLHADVSLEFVAARCGIPVGRLVRIEAGSRATRDETICIAKVLGIPVELLEPHEHCRQTGAPAVALSL